MKKSILFGALAFFAMSAMGIQNATAQEVDEKAKKAESTTVVEKEDAPSVTTITQEPVKEKKADCCANKKDETKKAECCTNKNVDSKKHECCAEKHADAKKADCCDNGKVDAKKAGCCSDRKPVDVKKADKSSQKQTKTDRKTVK